MPKRIKHGGRQKGTPNKITPSIREMLAGFVERKWPEVEKSFDKMNPTQKVTAFTKILPFVAPQFQSISFDLSDLSERDLEFILEKIKQQVKNE